MSNIEVSNILDKIGENDTHRRSVEKSLSVVDSNSDTYEMVQTYLKNTHSPIHNQYTMKLAKLFEVNASYDTRFYNNNVGNYKLLWHGTETSAVYSILCEGFRLKIASERNLFGRAIYFTNCSSKAANYTSTNPAKFDGSADGGKISPDLRYCGFVFLSQVATGKITEYCKKPSTKTPGKGLLKGMNSVLGSGQLKPSDFYERKIKKDTVEVPVGPLKRVYNKSECDLLQDEYAIYKCSQVRHRFLLMLEFTPTNPAT